MNYCAKFLTEDQLKQIDDLFAGEENHVLELSSDAIRTAIEEDRAVLAIDESNRVQGFVKYMYC